MEIFLELSLIIVITVVIAGIVRFFKQPLIIGYIVAGILMGPFFLDVVKSTETIATFSQIGITFLLFIVGISLNPKTIREVGKVSVITGIGQIIFTSFFGFLIAISFGFTYIEAAYIAIALTFSSTIIIMKLLSDKKHTQRLYGKISIGFLLVQDLFVILLLMIISSFSSGLIHADFTTSSLLIGLLFIVLFIIISKYILPKLSHFFAQSQEFLFIFSIGWGMGIAALFHYMGFSMEIGALIAGIALSMSPFNHEISSKLRPIRDFFIVLFFILLGSQMVFTNISEHGIPIIIFSLFILIGNPVIVLILMGILGYKSRTGFRAGLTVAQISEFSLILIGLGVAAGHLDGEILSMVTIIGLITISFSTYLILYAEKIYPSLAKFLKLFERKKIIHETTKSKQPEVILFGYDQIGRKLFRNLKKLKKQFLIIDFNPDIITSLKRESIKCRYGDGGDTEFLEDLDVSKTKMLISTIPDVETNQVLLKKVQAMNEDIILVFVGENPREAKRLYDAGAAYVILPKSLGGDHFSEILDKIKFDKKKFHKNKTKHLKFLDEFNGTS